jgi:hypothetical protein
LVTPLWNPMLYMPALMAGDPLNSDDSGVQTLAFKNAKTGAELGSRRS